MARKSQSGYAKKHVPQDPSYKKLKPGYFPVQLSYQLGPISQGPFGVAPWFHDGPRGLSEVNHRLYRRGRTYTMKIDIDNDAAPLMGGNTSVDVYALVNTWWIANAYAAGRAAYETATAEERARVGKGGRWNDFIPNNGFSSQIVGSWLTSGPGTILARDSGEHTLTRIEDLAGNVREFTWGPTTSASQFSLVKEYDDMDIVNSSPDQSGSAGGYIELDANVEATDIVRLQTDGNDPPYSRDTIGANQNYLVKIATIELGGTGSQRLSTGWFQAPCGYVWLNGIGNTFPEGKITVSYKSGDYKGVSALSMAE